MPPGWRGAVRGGRPVDAIGGPQQLRQHLRRQRPSGELARRAAQLQRLRQRAAEIGARRRQRDRLQFLRRGEAGRHREAGAAASRPRLTSRRVVMAGLLIGCGGRLQHGAAHQRCQDRQLVGVVAQRRGAGDRRLARRVRRRRVDRLAGQRRLGLPRAPGHRRGGAEHDRGAPAASVRRAIQHHGDVGDRPVERGLFALLQEHRARAGRQPAATARR